MNAICIISKEQEENLDICIAYSTFGVAKGNIAINAAKSIEEGDLLLIYMSSTGFIGTAIASSQAVQINESTNVPNWTYKRQGTENPPWTYLIPWKDYKTISPPYKLKFNNGLNEETGIKQGWLMQAMKNINSDETKKIIEAIGGVDYGK